MQAQKFGGPGGVFLGLVGFKKPKKGSKASNKIQRSSEIQQISGHVPGDVLETNVSVGSEDWPSQCLGRSMPRSRGSGLDVK